MATTHDRASSAGETGGLPGANAAPETSITTDAELAPTMPAANPPTSTTDVDSHDDGRGREGDAYDEPDTDLEAASPFTTSGTAASGTGGTGNTRDDSFGDTSAGRSDPGTEDEGPAEGSQYLPG